jgi:hypothetical protein
MPKKPGLDRGCAQKYEASKYRPSSQMNEAMPPTRSTMNCGCRRATPIARVDEWCVRLSSSQRRGLCVVPSAIGPLCTGVVDGSRKAWR